jgi:hypothetical protein
MLRPNRRDFWRDLLMEVLLEHEVATTARWMLEQSLQRDPSLTSIRHRTWSIADARRWTARLETTYLIRLFAVFEQALREYWKRGLGRNSEPPARTIINALTSRLKVPSAVSDSAHLVREYRNQLVHEIHELGVAVTLRDAQARLSRFIGRLPPDW